MVRTSVTHSAITSCATFLFSPQSDVICDLLLNRRTATWNLFVKYLPDFYYFYYHHCNWSFYLKSIVKRCWLFSRNSAFEINYHYYHHHHHYHHLGVSRECVFLKTFNILKNFDSFGSVEEKTDK